MAFVTLTIALLVTVTAGGPLPDGYLRSHIGTSHAFLALLAASVIGPHIAAGYVAASLARTRALLFGALSGAGFVAWNLHNMMFGPLLSSRISPVSMAMGMDWLLSWGTPLFGLVGGALWWRAQARTAAVRS